MLFFLLPFGPITCSYGFGYTTNNIICFGSHCFFLLHFFFFYYYVVVTLHWLGSTWRYRLTKNDILFIHISCIINCIIIIIIIVIIRNCSIIGKKRFIKKYDIKILYGSCITNLLSQGHTSFGSCRDVSVDENIHIAMDHQTALWLFKRLECRWAAGSEQETRPCCGVPSIEVIHEGKPISYIINRMRRDRHNNSYPLHLCA